MKSALTRDTNIRTPSGLVPLARLKPGDSVIGVADGQPVIDSIVSIEPATVDTEAYEVTVGKDVLFIGGDQAFGDETVARSPIGTLVTVMNDSGELVKGSLQGKFTKKYDDIIFSVSTNHHKLLVGRNGSILVETD